MIGTLAALTLMTLVVSRAAEDSQQMPVTVAQLGHSVTFRCQFSDSGRAFFYWNKEALGHLPQTVAEVIHGQAALVEEFKGSRFGVRKDGDLHFLTITNVTKEDEAVYFCQSKVTYGRAFINGTFLSVTDGNQLKQVNVTQQPKAEWVQPGDSVTMECSLASTNTDNGVQCPTVHSVYWFRAGAGGFSPGLIYTHRTDGQGEPSCVYSLSRTIQGSSDAGTYYCAVVTCGRILFGEGTNVEITSSRLVAALGGLLACSGAVIAFLVCYISRRKACVYKGSRSDSRHEVQTVDQVAEAPQMNYAALDFSTVRVKKGTMKTLPQDTLYSEVRAEAPNQR